MSRIPIGDLNLVDLVTITPISPAGPAVRFHLAGDDELTGGTARWEEVERPRRRSATEWVGTDPHRLKLPLMIDGMDVLSDGVDVPMEADIATLASWTQPASQTGQPPLLAVVGPIKSVPGTPLWVIDGLEWLTGTAVRQLDGQRIRQEVVVTLLEHTAAEVFLGPAAAARARAGL